MSVAGFGSGMLSTGSESASEVASWKRLKTDRWGW
jgi:hypothetical protein